MLQHTVLIARISSYSEKPGYTSTRQRNLFMHIRCSLKIHAQWNQENIYSNFPRFPQVRMVTTKIHSFNQSKNIFIFYFHYFGDGSIIYSLNHVSFLTLILPRTIASYFLYYLSLPQSVSKCVHQKLKEKFTIMFDRWNNKSLFNNHLLMVVSFETSFKSFFMPFAEKFLLIPKSKL